jgi:UDP-4-amino-4,6-dideoxy-N-acetyl-beta-L-altrosamine transaminase
MKFIPYSRQCIDKTDIKEVVRVLKSDFITQGPKIQEFESALAKYCGSRHAVVFNSGTSALHGAYFVSGLRKGDEFITSPVTFAATSNAGRYLGAKPVFVDVEYHTGNIDALKIEKKITKKTKLLVPVHYAGRPADLKKIRTTARKYHLPVVEDACHALGAHYRERKIGSCEYSDMTVLSFHPVKHITTGEGGAVLTNNKAFYKKLLMFRAHGITKDNFINESHGDWYYEMQLLGYNYRMTDFQAALGISQLKKLDLFVKRRREIAAFYDRAFHDHPSIDILPERGPCFSSYHLYPIILKGYSNKKRAFTFLKAKGLGVQVHYMPVYWHPYYRALGYKKGLCPVAEDFYQKVMSIPLYAAMSKNDASYVIKAVSALYE